MVSLGYLFIIATLSYVIWAASGAFERASTHLGRKMAPGVRGATINAIGSSMPELFTAVFFITGGYQQGFFGGFGTMVGSAVFNILIIPAAVFGTLLYTKQKTDIFNSLSLRKSLLRDAIFLLISQGLLIVLIRPQMYWWNAVLLMLFYGFYLWFVLRRSNKETQYLEDTATVGEGNVEKDTTANEKSVLYNLIRLDVYRLFLGRNPINNPRAWTILLIATSLMGLSCLFLVNLCNELGELWDVPILFIALVVAASATSVPDLFISVRDAKKGNTADALSNALGSNIFDICFALALPIFLFVVFNDSGVLNAFMYKEEWAISVFIRWVLLGLTVPSAFLLILPKFSLSQRLAGLTVLYSLFLFFLFIYVADLDILQKILQGIMAADVAQDLL